MGIKRIILSGHNSIGVERWGGELNGSPLKTLTVGIGLVELKCNFSIFFFSMFLSLPYTTKTG